MRLPDWQLRIILPVMAAAARAQSTPNRDLDKIVDELVAIAKHRGLESLLATLEREAESDAEKFRRLVNVA